MTQITVLEAREALFRANLYHFMPDYPALGYADLYQQIKANQQQAAADYHSGCSDWVANAGLELSDWLADLRTRPGIIATFHTGSYRLLNLCLATAGLPLALLVSADVVAREGRAMRQRQQQIHDGKDQNHPFELLEAEDPQVLRKLCRLLARGYQVIVYVDGNMGSDGHRMSAHLLTIPFLSGKLKVRQGIALMAYLARVPIYPIWSEWKHGRSRLIPSVPIFIEEGESREQYGVRVINALYSILEKAVEQDPATWECWQYLHPWIVPKKVSRIQTEEQYQGLRWHAFRHRKKLYLIDAQNYQFYLM